MADKAENYHKQGLRLFSVGKLQEAVEFFTRAIEINPEFPEAYLHRGGIFLETNRIVEGNADIQRAKDLRSGKFSGKGKGKSREKRSAKPLKVNWRDVDNIYEAVFPLDSRGVEYGDPGGGDGFEADGFPGDALSTAEGEGGFGKPDAGSRPSPAILELVNGRSLEFARVRLFEPTADDVSIIRQDGHVERVVPLEHIACIRTAEVRPGHKRMSNPLRGHVETIETVDGTIHHAAIHPDQDRDDILSCFSAEEQTPFMHKFIPMVNIRRRCLDRYLGEILLEKRFIGKDVLRKSLEEHRQAKNLQLGRIIAQRAKVMYSAIEEELDRAKREKVENQRKTGEILLASGLADKKQVMEALRCQKYLRGMKIGQFLVEKGVVQEKEIYIALAEKFRMPFVDLRRQKFSRNSLTLLSKKFVVRNEILPLALVNDILTVAVHHQKAAYLREEIMKERKCREVRFVLSQPAPLRMIIDMLYKKAG
ncbi:MAG TPA: tetratricopeptide repeat protein [Desulfobacteraceae bacterium]|nr:tetratricopeptide repeat protein [Desulfobacteraceae bacterium]